MMGEYNLGDDGETQPGGRWGTQTGGEGLIGKHKQGEDGT